MIPGQTYKLFWKNISSYDRLHSHTQYALLSFCFHSNIYWATHGNGGPGKLKHKMCSTCGIRKGFWRKTNYFESNLPLGPLVRSVWYLRQPGCLKSLSKRLVSITPGLKLKSIGKGKRSGLHCLSSELKVGYRRMR